MNRNVSLYPLIPFKRKKERPSRIFGEVYFLTARFTMNEAININFQRYVDYAYVP